MHIPHSLYIAFLCFFVFTEYSLADEYEREVCRNLYIFNPIAGEECHKRLDETIGISPKEAERRQNIKEIGEQRKKERIENCTTSDDSIVCLAETYELKKPHILNECSRLIELRNRRESKWINPDVMRFAFNMPRKHFKNGKNYPETMEIFGLYGTQMKSKNLVGKWVQTSYICWLDRNTDQILDIQIWDKK